MSDHYPQVIRFCAETPWAIRPEKLASIREMLALRASGVKLTAEEIQARVGAGPSQRKNSTTGTVAVIPVYGTLTPRADLMTEMSGGTSIQQLAQTFSAAVSDPSIGAILLDVDSPGGSTDLVTEFAAQIRDARGSKPIVAIANTDMASAAYWIASSADEIVVTPSGLVGSIGVFAMHQDISAAAEMEGVKTTLISAGKYKVESSPFEPLSDEARAAIQDRVDSFYSQFTRDVAKGRGTNADAVRSGFGEGRVVTAQAALKAGMADRIDTFEATVERLIVAAAPVSESWRKASALASRLNEPPDDQPSSEIDDSEAATSGLLFAQKAVAVRDAAEKLTADAKALRALTGAKREVLSAVAESLTGSAQALAEMLADTDPARHQNDVAREFLKFTRSAAA